MMEYIEREKVMDALLHEQYGYLCEDAIRSIPAADVQPVVRCRVCKYWRVSDWVDDACPCDILTEDRTVFTYAEDFCSYGEKGEER